MVGREKIKTSQMSQDVESNFDAEQLMPIQLHLHKHVGLIYGI